MMIVVRVFVFILLLIFLTPFHSLGNSLPEAIGSLRLTHIVSGEEARQEIDRLHGKRLSFQKGYIGTYEGENREAKLWVSEYGSDREATEAIGKMARMMKLSEQKNFWHFQEIPIEGVTVFFAMGMGQAHYFFYKGIKVFWLAVDPSQARAAVRDLLEKIP